jgi:hypothetical protein
MSYQLAARGLRPGMHNLAANSLLKPTNPKGEVKRSRADS